MPISSRGAAALLLALLLGFFTLHVVIPAMSRITGGFLAYYVGAEIARADSPGSHLYDDSWFSNRALAVSGGEARDVYLANPPTLAVVCLPLSYLDVKVARQVWVVLGAVCLIAALILICNTLGLSSNPWAVTALFAMALLSAPTREQVALGQIYAVLLLVHTMGWRGYIRSSEGVAGVCLGLAFVLKLSGWPIGLLMVAQRRWRALLWAAVTTIVLVVLSLPWVGSAAWSTFFLAALPRTLRSAAAALPAYQDTSGLWQHLFRYDASFNPEPLLDAPWLATLLTAASTAGAASALFLRRRPPAIAFALALVLTEVLSPAAEQYHYTLLMLPLALLWKESFRTGGVRFISCALLSTLLIAWPLSFKAGHAAWAVLPAYPRLLGGWLLFAGLILLPQEPAGMESSMMQNPNAGELSR